MSREMGFPDTGIVFPDRHIAVSLADGFPWLTVIIVGLVIVKGYGIGCVSSFTPHTKSVLRVLSY